MIVWATLPCSFSSWLQWDLGGRKGGMVILRWNSMVELKRKDFITWGTLCNVYWKRASVASFPPSPEVFPHPGRTSPVTHSHTVRGFLICFILKNPSSFEYTEVELNQLRPDSCCFAVWYQGLKPWKELGSELITKIVKYRQDRLCIWTNQR